jgi:4a-hydroxytetrahydrobiopterin dehydratase
MRATAKKTFNLSFALDELAKDGWAAKGVHIRKKYVFKTFEDAIAFMSLCAMDISKLNHHPEWSNVYNKVTVDLSTHDAGGVTKKDIGLAHKLDEIAIRFLPKS